MENKLERLKTFLSFLTALASSIVAMTSKQFIVLLILICVDTIFGWVKAFKTNTFKSNTARVGFMGKIVELMLVGCAKLLDWLFGTNFLEYTSLYYFMICEISSILENYAQINGNLPEGLVDILKALRENVANKIVKAVYDLLGGKKGD